uniref:Uncharacterized protein n=1 Tax=Opuntia streptacantha TaxID=393608 RepID=A0A7C8YS76_OPUST
MKQGYRTKRCCYKSSKSYHLHRFRRRPLHAIYHWRRSSKSSNSFQPGNLLESTEEGEDRANRVRKENVDRIVRGRSRSSDRIERGRQRLSESSGTKKEDTTPFFE